MAKKKSNGDETSLTSRQQKIVEQVKEQGFVTIEALAAQFDVSSQTIRREIIWLDKVEVLQRFHGGAGLREANIRLGYAEKKNTESNAKDKIGQHIARMIPDGASVFLDVGTTIEAVARALIGKKSLRIVTASLPAATILAGQPDIEVFVAGGNVQGPDGSLVGETTIANLAHFKVDYAILGCSGFDDDGTIMDFDAQKVSVKRAMLGNCRQAILTADASKFTRSALIRMSPLGAFQYLVTNEQAPEHIQQHIISSGIRLEIAE